MPPSNGSPESQNSATRLRRPPGATSARSIAVTDADLDQVDHQADLAADQGADYISMRRLSELVGATTLDGFATLGQLLTRHRADRYAPSIYRVNCR